jgi:hypothetical protein
MEYWKKYLVQYEAEDFDRVALNIRDVHFEDGTGWAMGFETRQNQDNPNQWRVVNPDKPGFASKTGSRVVNWVSRIFREDHVSNSPIFLTSMFPASGRIFFGADNLAVSVAAAPPVTCRWYVDTIFPACFPAVDSCDPPLPGCRKPRDNTSDIDEGAPGPAGR